VENIAVDRVAKALQSALDCLSMASKAKDEKSRVEHAQLARLWMRLAVEMSEQMSIPTETRN
jgi:hypothetical protein